MGRRICASCGCPALSATSLLYSDSRKVSIVLQIFLFEPPTPLLIDEEGSL